MDSNTSIRHLCLGENDRVSLNGKTESEGNWDTSEYHDTADSGYEKEIKSFTFYRMETEEVSEQYITSCFVDGLNACDGEINLEYEKNRISNEFAVKLCLEYEVKNDEKVVRRELLVALRGELYFVKFIINPEKDDVEPGVIFGRSILRLTKGIINFKNGILTIYPDFITFNDDSDDELDVILVSIDVSDLPPLDITDIPPFVYSMGKSARNKKQPLKNYKMSYNGGGPSLTINRPLTREELSREELEKDIYERILILSEKRPIIETLKYSGQHKKLLDSVLLDKLKLDGEVKVEEEVATEEFIRTYTGSNINVMPYRIYEKLGREQVKPVSHKITMLDHSKVKLMGILKDVLCQVGVTTILAKFLLLDIPVDRDVPIIVGRSFLYTCGAISNTIKGTTSTFNGIVHQKFYVANVRNAYGESDSDDEE
ncbi:reverse transcriptase domain-containing protein [Tanacetum coccineum]|uniref:Reverse transcriptase domain-containing protein n=1 Tax=Tanacetum coccineum TaxID=301880 RepID=A0ABQ5I8Z8_9ASTR